VCFCLFRISFKTSRKALLPTQKSLIIQSRDLRVRGPH
jgi:hypothetical protein